MPKENILHEYDNNKIINDAFSKALKSLINRLLISKKLNIHSITSRVKDRYSLEKKIDIKTYSALNDITDIIGLRIITHYSDDVDKIANLIEDEFLIDTDNSIDKRASLDPDRFGYLSLHYVISLGDDRTALPEYGEFKNLKAEIQIRSILQHTWAEIEHDIGYKATTDVPKNVRRQFSRLAGLLEIADSEFVNIRGSLESYRAEVEKNIQSAPETITLDSISLLEFANSDSVVESIDKSIAEITGFTLKDLHADNVSRYLKYLEYFEIETISELKKSLLDNKDLILKRASDIEKETGPVSKGISIFYLHQIFAGKLGDKKKILQFLNKTNMALEPDREEFANYLIELVSTNT